MAVGVAQKVLLTGHAHEYQVGDRERRGDDPFGRQAYPRVNGDRLLDGAVTGEQAASINVMTGNRPTLIVSTATAMNANTSADSCHRLRGSRKSTTPNSTVTNGLM